MGKFISSELRYAEELLNKGKTKEDLEITAKLIKKGTFNIWQMSI